MTLPPYVPHISMLMILLQIATEQTAEWSYNNLMNINAIKTKDMLFQVLWQTCGCTAHQPQWCGDQKGEKHKVTWFNYKWRFNMDSTHHRYIDIGRETHCPLHYLVYINDLIKEVKKLNLGVKGDEELVSILAFADDIVIIANSEKEIQQILKCVETWCKNWRLKVNTEKTNIVHFRRKWKQQTTFKFKFENNWLNIVDRYKYLWVVLQENRDFKITEEVLAGAAGRALGAIISEFECLKNVGFNTFSKMY